jgi:hypothetical protein
MLKVTVSNVKARIAAGESIDSIVANGLGPEWSKLRRRIHHGGAMDSYRPVRWGASSRWQTNAAPLT